jgi:hypothetical protein
MRQDDNGLPFEFPASRGRFKTSSDIVERLFGKHAT